MRPKLSLPKHKEEEEVTFIELHASIFSQLSQK